MRAYIIKHKYEGPMSQCPSIVGRPMSQGLSIVGGPMSQGPSIVFKFPSKKRK